MSLLFQQLVQLGFKLIQPLFQLAVTLVDGWGDGIGIGIPIGTPSAHTAAVSTSKARAITSALSKTSSLPLTVFFIVCKAGLVITCAITQPSACHRTLSHWACFVSSCHILGINRLMRQIYE